MELWEIRQKKEEGFELYKPYSPPTLQKQGFILMAFPLFLYVFTEMLLILSIAFVVICSLFLLLSIVATLVMFRRARVSWYVEIVSSFSKQRQRGLVLRALRL